MVQGGRCPQRHPQKAIATLTALARIGARDDWTCWICGNAIDSTAPAGSPHAGSLDHVTPKAKGGKTSDDNLRIAHRRCNTRRGSHMPELEWPDGYQYVNTTPLWPILQRLTRKRGSNEIAALLIDPTEAEELSTWLVEVATQATGVAWEVTTETMGEMTALRLRAGMT